MYLKKYLFVCIGAMPEALDLACERLRDCLVPEQSAWQAEVPMEILDEHRARVTYCGKRWRPFALEVSVRLLEAGIAKVVYTLRYDADDRRRVVFFTEPGDLMGYLKKYLAVAHIRTHVVVDLD